MMNLKIQNINFVLAFTGNENDGSIAESITNGSVEPEGWKRRLETWISTPTYQAQRMTAG